MVKKIFFSLVLLLGVGIGVGLALSKSEEASNAVIAKPVVAAEKETILEENPVISENAQQKILAQSSEEMFQSLNMKLTANLKSGWIYVRTEIISDMDSGNHGIFPNGVAIPLHQVNDAWFFLNEEMLVTEMVSIMRTVDGEIVQVGIYKDGVVVNSVIDDPLVQEPYSPILDGGFGYDLEQIQKNGEAFTWAETVDSRGIEQIEFYSSESFEMPIEAVGYDQRITATETYVRFNKETGELMSKDVISYFEDGTKRTVLHIEQIISQDAPSDEAMAFFKTMSE